MVLLAGHAGLLAWNAAVHSPTVDEPAHLASGIDILRTRNFRTYCVNPHLPRVVGALPVLLSGRAPAPRKITPPSNALRPEFTIGESLVEALGSSVFYTVTIARWACIPFSVLGAWSCFAWGRWAYGRWSGFLALVLWCAFPEILGHGALLTPDVPSAATGVLAGFLFCRWLEYPTRRATFLAGLALGMALLTKLTWVLLPPLFVVIWLATTAQRWRQNQTPLSWKHGVLGIALILGSGWLLVNTAYLFRGTWRPLGEYAFYSKSLSGLDHRDIASGASGNRFRENPLGRIPVPLPADYLTGIDLQRRDFEQWGGVIVAGDVHPGRPWYFYLYAAAVKLPLGFCVLLLMRVLIMRRVDWTLTDGVALAVPLAIVLAALMMPGLAYFRYLMPVWPFLFVWTSRLSTVAERAWEARVAVGFPVAWIVASSLSVYPHSLSYFNEAGGGPEHGATHLIDSQLDWGQDLLFLKEWQDRHPEASPLHTAFFGPVGPSAVGLQFQLPPSARHNTSADSARPAGWYAISAHFAQGGIGATFDEHGNQIMITDRRYCDFQLSDPVDRVGYSIMIYHVERDR